jgi:hypothetical protein
MIDLLKELYGEDIFNILLKLIFEFLYYLLASLVGAIIREFNITKTSVLKIIGTSLLSSCILFVCGTWIRTKIPDSRLIFGLGIVLCASLPNLKKIIFTKKGLKAIVGLFNDKLRRFFDDLKD